MLKNFKKFALGNEQLKALKGGEITCSLTVNDPSGPITYGGSCGSSNMNDCVQWAGQQASQMAIATGYQVDYACMAP